EARVLGGQQRVIAVPEDALGIGLEHAPLGRPQVVVATVPADTDAGPDQEVVPAIAGDLDGGEEWHILDRHPLDADRGVRRPILAEPPADAGPAADAVLVVLVEPAGVVVTAQAQAVGAVEDPRVAPTHRVPLEHVPGHGLEPELLAAATPGPPGPDVLEAGWEVQDVEVPLVEHEAPGHARVRVDPGPEHQGPGLRLLHGDQD